MLAFVWVFVWVRMPVLMFLCVPCATINVFTGSFHIPIIKPVMNYTVYSKYTHTHTNAGTRARTRTQTGACAWTQRHANINIYICMYVI